jgi:hypothetical protein
LPTASIGRHSVYGQQIQRDQNVNPRTGQRHGGYCPIRSLACVGPKHRLDFVHTAAINVTDVVVNYGRKGTAGQTNTKSFADAAAAQKHADKLIQEKTGKGYVEVRAGR